MAKSNKVEFAVEQEATPGTAETLVAADVLVKIRENPTMTLDVEQDDLEEVQAVSSTTPSVAGQKSIAFGVSYILRGPGDLTTTPIFSDMWNAAMLEGFDAEKISIGAIATGPFVVGETITGGTSSATGFVIKEALDGDAEINYYVLSGTFQNAEVITGGTSGASATTSSTGSDAGYVFRPADSVDLTTHAATCGLYRDGQRWVGRGMLSDIQWEFSNGKSCVITQNFAGAYSAHDDTALLNATVAQRTAAIPKFLNVDLLIGTYKPTGVVDVTINFPTNPTPVEDANDTAGDGFLYADYDRQLPTVTLEIDQVAVATKDFFQNLIDGTTQVFECTIGSGQAAGSKYTFSAPGAQVRSVGIGSRDPRRATFPVELGLTGSNNEELVIFQH